MFKRLKIYIILSVISFIIFILELNYVIRIGEFINKFFPCTPCEEKYPKEAFTCAHEYYDIPATCKAVCPCFEIYDIILMFLMLGVFIISIIMIAFKLIKNKSIKVSD